MTRCVDTSWPLSPVTLVITQWAHEQSGRSGKDGGIAWAQQERLLLTKADLAIAIIECLVCQQQRSTIEPLLWHRFPGWSASWWQVITMDCRHDGRAAFCSYWNKQLFWYRFVFSTCNASAKLPFMDLQNALFSIMARHTSLLLIKDITSQQRKCSSGFMFMKFVDHVPQHPEANGLIQWWNGLLKTQLQC